MHTLTDEELTQITRRVRPTAQARVLRESGIPFRIVAGRPLVARTALIETLSMGRHTTGPQLRLKRA